MQITAIDPNRSAAIDRSRGLLESARDSLMQAIVSTTASKRIDPSLPFWSFRAVSAIGMTMGLVQAVDGAEELTGIPFPLMVYEDGLADARRFIVDAASAVHDGHPADPAAFIQANAKLHSVLIQLDFDIKRHTPERSR